MVVAGRLVLLSTSIKKWLKRPYSCRWRDKAVSVNGLNTRLARIAQTTFPTHRQFGVLPAASRNPIVASNKPTLFLTLLLSVTAVTVGSACNARNVAAIAASRSP